MPTSHARQVAQPDRPGGDDPPARPVVVEVDADTIGANAARWAAAEAARRGVSLRIVLPDDHTDTPASRAAFARALAAARDTAPDVPVAVGRTTEPPLRAELRASTDAGLLVVSGPAPHVDELIAGSGCPVVVVPGSGAAGDHDGPVVLAAGPLTGPEVAEFAAAEAAARGTWLRVVRTWSDPMVELGRFRPGAVARWDGADDRHRRELAEQLEAWTVARPGLHVEPLVVNDRCAEFLLAMSERARLLVLGRPSREPTGGLASPAETLGRYAPCPVAVVPPPAATGRAAADAAGLVADLPR
jgi:nucleotide-binding universal stress UspA family protein